MVDINHLRPTTIEWLRTNHQTYEWTDGTAGYLRFDGLLRAPYGANNKFSVSYHTIKYIPFHCVKAE